MMHPRNKNMDNTILLKVLKYAKSRINHHENYAFSNQIVTEYYKPATSENLRDQLKRRIAVVEEYEEYEKNINEIIKELENSTL
jgi:hypothetical protein